MKIIIMTDMEGCAGVVDAPDYTSKASRYYEQGCELATLEASAAVEGALQAGATEVLVVDGHGPGAMKRHLLHPRARLLAGHPFPPSLTFGCDGTFAASIIIGQHAKANTDGGHLCHTMSFQVDEYRLNDTPVGEIGLWMLMTGYFGLPVVMVSGDQAACDEACGLVSNVETAPVKWGVKRGSAAGLMAEENRAFNASAIHLHPDEARAVIRNAAFRAVKRIPEIAPLRFDPPYSLTIAMRPEAGQTQGMKFVTKSKDFLDLMKQRPGKPMKPATRKAPAPKKPKKPVRRGARK